MIPSRLLILMMTALAGFAQPTRIELLSRSDDHARRPGASAMAALPEFSRDEKFVLFLSDASNLTTNEPGAKQTLNVHMANRLTHETKLLSVGADGRPANEAVQNFEVSANNTRVLIETAASNMVSDDTNNSSDVFVRDLALGQNILVTTTTNGGVGVRGGFNASMSADGNVVVFMSSDPKLVEERSPAFSRVFVRNIAAGVTMAAPTPSPTKLQYAHDPSISEDGRYVTFTADFFDNATAKFWSTNVLCDLQTGTAVAMADGIQQSFLWEPIIAAGGKFVTFGIQIGYGPVTNLLAHYSIESGTTELVASNNIVASLRPVAISADGDSILYFQSNVYYVWRAAGETRVFPHEDDGTPIALPKVFGMASLSANGRFVTFTTDAPLLASAGGVTQFRTYVYDVDNDQLSVAPVTSPASGPSDPVANADGSVIVFSAAAAGIQDASEQAIQNIYAWDRASGTAEIVSQSHINAFENSAELDSKISETGATSDDGTKVVFTSRAPATDLVDTNGTSDVFVLDRTTGRKKLVSVSGDGTKSGSGASFRPAISGNSRMAAFFSRATNVVGGADIRLAQLFVRDTETGVTRWVTNTVSNGQHVPPALESLRFSYDGNRLAFQSRLTSSEFPQIYVYDWASNSVAWVSRPAPGVETQNIYSQPAISRDGELVAFRGPNGTPFGLSPSATVFVRDLRTGVIRAAPIPGSPSGTPVYPQVMQFNRASTTLFFGARPIYFLSWDLSGTSYSVLATNCLEASVSDDGRWVAFARRDGSTSLRTQVWLRDTVGKTESMISSNVAMGDLTSTRPKVTGDGRFVVFQSRAKNLVAQDGNGTADLFMFDIERRRLDLISAGLSGATANSASLRPVLSPDDSFVAFVSYASDLVPHDYNESADIFAAYFRPPDSDADNIDDRWEMAEFGSLTHEMSGDADGDGMSDANEFEAGTDPTSATSNVRLVSAQTDANGDLEVQWSGVAGRSYRLQARTSLDASDSWKDLADPIIAAMKNTAVTLALPQQYDQMFVRVVTAD